MDVEVLVSSLLRAQGFDVSADVLTVQSGKIVKVDFHPPNVLLYTELDADRGFAYNENFFVNPRCRHKGIGTRLLMAHEAICREMKLTVLINNNRNPAFWRRQGYRRLNPFWQMALARRLAVEFQGQSMYKRVW
ncbi:MAG: GNAT family N-acetyltransferase [Gammaproteobacteria bacterium]|nr:GNAT family N-acetyltransferase [Gammaproteobacteria bacterium]MCB1925976.1 GNAT family N-acetyltransferase [Gammaproteobacteria bacterium]